MTEATTFKQFLRQFPHYTEAAYDVAAPYISKQYIKKGDHILKQGSYCRHIYFVIAGIFKIYYLRDGVEVTTCFCRENRFATSYQSLLSGEPSELGIQAIEDAEILKIRYEDLNTLYAQSPFWQQIGRIVAEQEYIIAACYTRLINDKSAKQRYLEILENEPELLQRVPLVDLASYLQVTPETISRIRKELATS